MYNLKNQYENQTSEEIMRRGEEMHLFSSTFLKTPPPAYDPILTPIFTTIGLSGSITVGAFTVSTAALASTIATTSIVAGFQLGSRP
jgi:hypothetical protein